MTELNIRCRKQKKDMLALTANVFLSEPMTLLCGAVFLFFLAALPVIRLVILTVNRIFSPILLLYVIALAAMLWINIRRSIFETYPGISEYTFSENGFTVKDAQGMCSLPYSSVYSLTETKKHFYIKLGKYSAYVIPKEYLTPEEGERLRKLPFPKRRTGKYGDSFFEGKFAEKTASERSADFENAYMTFEFTLSPDYPKAAAAAAMLTPDNFINMFYPFMLVLMIISAVLTTIAALILTAAYMVISFVSARSRKSKELQRAVNNDNRAVYRFCENGFEYSQGGNSITAEYENIKSIKKKNIIAFMTLKNGKKFIMPVTDDVFYEIQKNLHSEVK